MSIWDANECSRLQLLEFKARENFETGLAVTFTADGDHLIGGYKENILGVWQVKDGKQVATMRTGWSVESVAASKDGKYIAAGTWDGELWVWDAKTYKEVFTVTKLAPIMGMDFSPDSTRLVIADSPPAIWDVAARRKVQVLHKWMFIFPANTESTFKFSPQGDRVAGAGWESVRVWDSNDGRLLVYIPLKADATRGLLWTDDHLFVTIKGGGIWQLDATTGSTIAMWLGTQTSPDVSSLSLPHHGKFIACSAGDTTTFWDTSTRSQLGLIRHISSVNSFSLSPDGQLLAATVADEKTVVKLLPFITPETPIPNAALDMWRHGQLTQAEGILTATIRRLQTHHALACRALVRARLQQWDAALLDVNESIKMQRSIVGYIAKCVALVGKGEKQQGLAACDIAFQHFRSDDHVALLLLIKPVVLFMAGEHVAAISRMDDLIADAEGNSVLYVIQANMHFLHGNLHMESGSYERAIQSFIEARLKLSERTNRPPLIVSLISGWKFDDLGLAIQKRLSEALLAVGRTKEAGEFVPHVVDHRSSIGEAVLHLNSTRGQFTKV